MARRMFLERRTYRQNRLQDAARLLPFLGVILIFGPIFISAEGGAEGDVPGAANLAGGLVYYFAVWILLILLTALVGRAMGRGAAREPRDTDMDEDPPPRPQPGMGTARPRPHEEP